MLDYFVFYLLYENHINFLSSVPTNMESDDPGLGNYASWDEPTRIQFLQAELNGKRPLIRTSDIGMFCFLNLS